MGIRTIGVISPSEMGHAVAKVLGAAGLRVITCLEGRSHRTQDRSAQAGIIAVGDDRTFLCEADVILSILPAGNAVAMAERLAVAIWATGTDLVYVDCNAIAPHTACTIGKLLAAVGVRYVDGAIIGGPPASRSRPTRLYVSGPDAPSLSQLATPEFQVRVIGSSVGDASGLKMCYAALTKGLTALATEALTAADALGLGGPLRRELEDSQGQLLAWIERVIPTMPPKAEGWVGEMEEIAATFGGVGLPPELMEGAAVLYRLVSEAVLREESRATLSQARQVSDVTKRLAVHVLQEESIAESTDG